MKYRAKQSGMIKMIYTLTNVCVDATIDELFSLGYISENYKNYLTTIPV
jgi:hypothetical protein